ncbi:MAG: hypothetical protein WD845_06100 [Pirellulales bacterium]
MTRPPEDAVVQAARRESVLALGTWLVAMTYTITYCYLYGYGRPVDTLSFVLWFPDWVFWGIIAPWLVCTMISVVFAFGIMGNESLGDEIDVDLSAETSSEGGHAG